MITVAFLVFYELLFNKNFTLNNICTKFFIPGGIINDIRKSKAREIYFQGI